MTEENGIYRHKKAAMAVLTVISALLMLTVSMIPLATAYAEEEEDQMMTTDALFKIDEGTRDAINYWMYLLPITGTVYTALDFLTGNERYGGDAGDNESIKDYAREVDALRSAEQQYNLLMLASNLVQNDTQTWKLTDAYLNRASEISAGSLWYEGAKFDADGILEFGGIYDAIATGNLNTQDVLDRAIEASVNLREVWNDTNYGESLQIELIWDGGTTGKSTSALYSDFFTLATASATENIVYLSQTVGDASSPTNSTIWSYNGAGTITPVLAGSSAIPLVKGSNDISALPSGFYKLSPGTYGGPFLSSVSVGAAPVKGAMGIICDEKYGYAFSDGENIMVHWDGTTVESNSLDYKITGSDNAQTSHGSPLAIVKSYSDYLEQLTLLLFESAQSAQVMWTISANSHTSNILLSPSSLIPHLKNVGVDAEQSYAMYIMALDQIGQYNASYGGVLKDGMTKVSAQSLDLYCHGSIYAADGTAIAQDVIFTPYVYLKDWTIYAGQNNTFGQDGLVMVWDKASTAVGWEIASTAGNYQSIAVQKGAYFLPDEIIYDGSQVQNIHLEVEEIQRLTAFDALDWDRIDAPKVLSATTLIMIIVIELGMIIALLGYIFRTPGLIIAGLVVILIGLVASDWIARVALGN